MSADALSPVEFDERQLDYRALSGAAVGSLVFGSLSVLIFLAGRDTLESAIMLTPLPLVGIALGLVALRRIRANPEHYSGAPAAKAGIALSAACLAGGLAFAYYVRATELPPGYTRTSFAEFKPSEVDLRGEHFVPPQIAALDGKKVFIKGYMRPGTHYSAGGSSVAQNIKQFLLVRDNNQCCFGDISQVQYFDQVAVDLSGPLTVDYTTGLYRIGGTLHINPRNIGRNSPVFQLEADHAE